LHLSAGFFAVFDTYEDIWTRHITATWLSTGLEALNSPPLIDLSFIQSVYSKDDSGFVDFSAAFFC